MSATLTARDILSFLDSRASKPKPEDEEKRRQYRLAAAVLAAIQHPESLNPVSGGPVPGEARRLLKDELVRATGRRFDGQVMLQLDSRREALKQLKTRENMLAALQANPDERTGPVQNQFEHYLKRDAKAIAEQRPDELSATLQVLVWLDGILDDVPSLDLVRMQAGRQNLLGVFEAIAGDKIFRGRRQEMENLRSYVGVLPPESLLSRLSDKLFGWTKPDMRPALSVSGPGGVGKSALIARFMLEHSRLPEGVRIPFGYLDFDRPALSMSEPATLVMEMLRQLDLQFPESGKFRSLIDFLNKQSGGDESGMWNSYVNRQEAILSVMADMLGTTQMLLGPRPYVLVLDTFEEVQYRGESTAFPFWTVLIDMQNRWPFLRVVICGRSPVTTLTLAGKSPEQLVLGDLDNEAAVAFLKSQGVENEKLASALVKQVGGVPLSLKLAASVVKREGGDGSGVRDFSGRSTFWFSASDEVIQGQLYDRILGHIHDERVKRLAYPGLILRRIRADVILNVLNEPCGLGLASIQEAEELFQILRNETALVASDSADGSLVHRADVRRMTLKFFIQRLPAQVEQIRRAAVAWYSSQKDDWRAKAEELYHRLQLGEFISPRDVEHREIRASLQASIAELPTSAQTHLATMGFKISDEVLAQASQAQSEAYTAAQVEELLPYGITAVSQARFLLQSLFPLDHKSPLYRSAARVAMQQDQYDEALDWIEKGTSLALQAGDTAEVLRLTVDRVWTLRHLNAEDVGEATEILGRYAAMQNYQEDLMLHRILLWDVASFNGTLGQRQTLLREIRERFITLTPLEMWNLFPACKQIVHDLALSFSDFASLFRAKLTSPDGPFGAIEFSDPKVHYNFVQLMSAATSSANTIPDDRSLILTFLTLCTEWPYRCLAVQPPYGGHNYDRSESAALA